jgi:HlyD family secretion protein
VIAALIVAVGIVIVAWRLMRPHATPSGLTLYGNVDLRQVDLPFNGTERIAAVLAQEGDRVHAGQVLARLDTSRLAPQVAEAAAKVAAQQAVVARFHHGSRPEEVDQARASLSSARADADNARDQYQRLLSLGAQHIVSQQNVDNARALMQMADDKRVSAEKALSLAVAGPRAEDVAQAEAGLRGDEARLALLRQQLRDAALVAPVDGIVRARLMEPGEMASPQRPVFSLAIVDPKWVRAYVAEADLGRVHLGMPATIAVDAFAGQPFSGWVGFISPVSEFTPKQVQTEALRTSLVYEVRVFVHDSTDRLRLGMPATVSLGAPAPAAGGDTARSRSVPVVSSDPTGGAR